MNENKAIKICNWIERNFYDLSLFWLLLLVGIGLIATFTKSLIILLIVAISSIIPIFFIVYQKDLKQTYNLEYNHYENTFEVKIS